MNSKKLKQMSFIELIKYLIGLFIHDIKPLLRFFVDVP